MLNKIDERVKRLRFLDDRFMKICFKDHPELVEKVLQIIFDTKDIKVKETFSQDYIANINGKSVVLDIIAESTDDILYDLEVQRSDEGADIKRIRYISAMLDTRSLEMKRKYSELGETYIIFITENDYFKKGKQVYHIEKTIRETKEKVDDGLHIMYINTSYVSDDDLGKLCHDFRCDDPKEMKIKELKEVASYYKEDKGGLLGMSVLEEVKAEGIAEGETRGIISTYINLYNQKAITLEVALANLKMSKEEFLSKVK